MVHNSQHKKYTHVYALVRIDDFGPDIPFNADSVVVTKVFSDQEKAESEAERLNKLNGEKDCHYFVRITRMEDR